MFDSFNKPFVRTSYALLPYLYGQHGTGYASIFIELKLLILFITFTLSFSGLCPDTPSGTLSLNPAKGEYIPFGIPVLF